MITHVLATDCLVTTATPWPAPLLLSLLRCQSSVAGLRCEVVPPVNQGGLKRPISTLHEDVVGCIFCDLALTLTFEPNEDRNKSKFITSMCTRAILCSVLTSCHPCHWPGESRAGPPLWTHMSQRQPSSTEIFHAAFCQTRCQIHFLASFAPHKSDRHSCLSPY